MQVQMAERGAREVAERGGNIDRRCMHAIARSLAA
jgi:hypothetical protein